MIIGKNIQTGEDVHLDLKTLIRTRLLLQANSGGGKSWAARRIMEQTNKEVQQIIIDTEGEFSTLREKYDYLLVGPDGEIPATSKTADLLPKKIMQMKISAIIDLSEMSKTEKCSYIKIFLESLLRLPREFWKPLLVFIDESHDFAPEGTKGKAESKPAVISLCSKGRKRKYCPILMTQRGAKLDKDAAAECNNKLTGLANIDIDRKRAAEDLGFGKNEERSLRELEPGEMYVYGSAISREVIKIKIGKVFTTHEEEDGEITKPSKTPNNIQKLLKNFIDLPKEAEAELKTKQDLQNKINELKKELRISKNAQVKPLIKVDEKGLERAFVQGVKESEKDFRELENYCMQLERKFREIGKIMGVDKVFKIFKMPKFNSKKIIPTFPEPKPINSHKIIDRGSQRDVKTYDTSNDIDDDIQLGICSKKIYSFLYNHQERSFTKQQVGAFTGYSHKSGGFSNSIYKLNTMGLIMKSNNALQIKDVNPDLAGEYYFSKEAIMKNLRTCPLKIYQLLIDNPYEDFTKEQIGEDTGYSYTSGGFSNAIYKLNSLGLIEKNGNSIKLNQELLEI